METLATPHSEQILVSCGYKEKTIYVEKSVQNQKTKKKQKSITWFNLPYSKNRKNKY